MPGSHCILVVTVLIRQDVPLLNKKELEMQRMELLWRLSGTHPDIFLGISMLLFCLSMLNPANREIARFLSRQTTNERTDEQTEPIA